MPPSRFGRFTIGITLKIPEFTMSSNDNVPSTPSPLDALPKDATGTQILEAALASNLPVEEIVGILAYEFPERDAQDKDPLAWIPIVETAGASAQDIQDLVSQVLFWNDYPNENDGATRKCEAFIKFAARHWRRVPKATFVRVVERIVTNDAEFILEHFTTISWMFAKYGGAPDWHSEGRHRTIHEIPTAMDEHFMATAKIGEGEAMPFLRRACDGVQVIYTMAQVASILKMPLDVRKRIVGQIISRTSNPGAVVPPVRNLATVYLAIQVLVSQGYDEDLERKLVDSITWSPAERRHDRVVPKTDDDPERAVRLFRWYLKYLEEVPVAREAWMSRWSTPEGVRQQTIDRLVDTYRKALVSMGFRFERVAYRTNPRSGESRPEVRFVERGLTKVYVHDLRGDRNEDRIPDGAEVIVASFIRGEALFRRHDTIGWRTQFHPVAPPSDSMVKKAWDHGDGKI